MSHEQGSPTDPIEEWLTRHPRRYSTGEEARIGDFVDFGFDGKFSNGPSIDLMGEPWWGEILQLDCLDAIVDTHLNSVQRYPIEALKFLARQTAGTSPEAERHFMADMETIKREDAPA
jgi:hypothetical protein